MNTQQLLLANIIKNPDEDSVRLVYADYLEENTEGYAHRSDYIRSAIKNSNKYEWCRFPASYHVGFDATLGEGVRGEWLNGFAHTITCTAEDFFKHADTLIWHEGMTDECPNCKGTKEEPGAAHDYPCYICGPRDRYGNLGYGTGRVPRPCPLTAHPIRRVVLTTRPDASDIPLTGTTTNEDVLNHYALKWPGIEFVLPEQTSDVPEPDDEVVTF